MLSQIFHFFFFYEKIPKLLFCFLPPVGRRENFRTHNRLGPSSLLHARAENRSIPFAGLTTTTVGRRDDFSSARELASYQTRTQDTISVGVRGRKNINCFEYHTLYDSLGTRVCPYTNISFVNLRGNLEMTGKFVGKVIYFIAPNISGAGGRTAGRPKIYGSVWSSGSRL